MLRSIRCVGVWLSFRVGAPPLCANRNSLSAWPAAAANKLQLQSAAAAADFFCYAAETAYHIKSAMKLTYLSFFLFFFLYPSPSLPPAFPSPAFPYRLP